MMTNTLSDDALRNLPGGFSAPTRDSQLTFRQLLNAMSFPGRIVEIAPESFDHPPQLSAAAAALLTALPDAQTQIWLSGSLRVARLPANYLRFHTDALLLDPQATAKAELVWIAYGDHEAVNLTDFSAGTALEPHLSATLIIDLPAFAFDEAASPDGIRMRWQGPGIQSESIVAVKGLSKTFWHQRQQQHAMFPQGVDLVFTSDHALLALPRTTQLEIL